MILLCFILRKYARFDAGREAVQGLAKIVTYALVASIFFVLMEIFTVFYSQVPEHIQHFRYLFVGLHGHYALVPWMWAAGHPGSRSADPFDQPAKPENETLLGIACAAVFASLWIEKGLGLVVTGFIPSPLEKITSIFPPGRKWPLPWGSGFGTPDPYGLIQGCRRGEGGGGRIGSARGFKERQADGLTQGASRPGRDSRTASLEATRTIGWRKPYAHP